MTKTKLMLGDNIESLKKLPANSIDSVVTDPPYGLSFMGKKWDYDVPSVDFWKEVYRVLKPGGHVLSFGGTRTYHRMVVNIEDAGFEIRDQIMWIYGSGFPKSLNVGKAVDKLNGNEREVIGKRWELSRDGVKRNPKNHNDEETQTIKNMAVPSWNIDVTKGTSEWEGFGTALKPANEPICLARKPLSEKSVAENVLKWRTGGINVDGCRVETTDSLIGGGYTGNNNMVTANYALKDGRKTPPTNKLTKDDFIQPEGRFPANIIFDEEAAEMLDEQSGQSRSSDSKWNGNGKELTHEWGYKKYKRETGYTDKGGASRFFYQAKVSKAERNMGLEEGNKSTHPTVKPINLMTYLCRLITPPNGIILDTFMGSGSTGIAAQLEGFRFVGMEMDEDYFKIAEARIKNFEKYKKFTK
jgi:DNA modification methylase